MAELNHANEVSEVIRRASEIDDQTRLLAASDRDIAEFVAAAEEAGISRDATLQALRERLEYVREAYAGGQLCFAMSADGRSYVARILSLEADSAKVRFMSGGEVQLSVSQLRPLQLGPGHRLEYQSPSMKMWLTTDVVRYNADTQAVSFNYWGTEETVPLDQVRLPRTPKAEELTARATNIAIGIASALGGGVLGALVMRFIMK